MTDPNDTKKGNDAKKGANGEPPKDPSAGQLTLTPASESPPIPPEEFAKLPKAIREQISSFVGMAGPIIRGPDRLLERVPPDQAAECIKAIIEMTRDQTAQSLEGHKVEVASGERTHTRLVWLAFAGMVLISTLVIVSLVLNKDAVVQVLVPLIGGLAAGSFGGYGLGKASQ